MVFLYPQQFEWCHGPRGYKDYRSYLWRERWSADGDSLFSVDHLKPVTSDPQLACEYQNLVYACPQCNALKQDQDLSWIPDEPLTQHLEVLLDGTIRALTRKGIAIIAVCRLDRPKLNEARRIMLELLQTLMRTQGRETQRLRLYLLGYPDNLPRLSVLHPPEGNSRPRWDCQQLL